MSRERSVSGSIYIAVDPGVAYDAVSDVREMGRWSPENTGAVVEGDFGAARVGMSFLGSNKRGPMRWQTRCTVTAADPGERFAFDVNGYGFAGRTVPMSIASWEYTFEAVEGGTLVTETWVDGRTRWPRLLKRAFDPIATRRQTFADFQEGNIRRTLQNLKAALES